MGEGADICMLKEYLEKNYGYNEPIFINEIRLDGINDDALLQFLDAVFQGEKYSELSNSDTGILLKNYAKQRNYSKELLSSVLSGITGSAAIKLIEWGIIYEFTL